MTCYCVLRDNVSPRFCFDNIVWLEIGNRDELPGLLLTGCVTRGESLVPTTETMNVKGAAQPGRKRSVNWEEFVRAVAKEKLCGTQAALQGL